MTGEVAMEVVTLHATDGVVRQVHVQRGHRLALIQERRDIGDQVSAYTDTGGRDVHGRRVFDESGPVLR